MERGPKGWIRVEDELPEAEERVLVWRKRGNRAEIRRWDTVWLDDGDWYPEGDKVTHWQPLPEGPDREEGQP
jgi:hypothetical protein